MFSFAFTSVHNNIKSTKVNALINSVISLKKSQFRCFSLKQKVCDVGFNNNLSTNIF